jgi:hypothetical protein
VLTKDVVKLYARMEQMETNLKGNETKYECKWMCKYLVIPLTMKTLCEEESHSKN